MVVLENIFVTSIFDNKHCENCNANKNEKKDNKQYHPPRAIQNIPTDTANNMKYSVGEGVEAAKIKKCIPHSCKKKLAFYLYIVHFQ